jgi:hypothetical protein
MPTPLFTSSSTPPYKELFNISGCSKRRISSPKLVGLLFVQHFPKDLRRFFKEG